VFQDFFITYPPFRRSWLTACSLGAGIVLTDEAGLPLFFSCPITYGIIALSPGLALMLKFTLVFLILKKLWFDSWPSVILCGRLAPAAPVFGRAIICRPRVAGLNAFIPLAGFEPLLKSSDTKFFMLIVV